MLGCERLAVCRASAWNRARKVGSSTYSRRRILTATSRPRTSSVARHTSPIPPPASLVQDRAHDGLRDGGCELVAADLGCAAAVLEDDRHGDLRLGVRRSEGHEPRVRLAARPLLGGAGLARHLD